MIVRQEARDWAIMQAERAGQHLPATNAYETFRWQPEMHYYVPPAARMVQGVNVPAWILTGWQDANSPMYWIVRSVGARHGIAWENVQVIVAINFAVFIGVQWLFLGAILKPTCPCAKVITGCAVFALCLWVIPRTEGLEGVPAILAFGTWIVWFGVALVAVAKTIRKAIAKGFGRPPHRSTP